MTEKKNKIPTATELNEEALETVSGGESGDLLRPIKIYWRAECTCGYRLTVTDKNTDHVVCPDCNRVITKS